MEKLIELLNEYQYLMFVYENDLLLLRIGSNVKVGGETFIISKKLGFIKWLVDNDKIDIDKVIDTAKSFGIDTYYYEEGIDDIYIPLLMVLAVEDNPIEFLISILK